MIIPSIDIQDGQAVQLVGGREKALDGGDPLECAARFAVAGELAVIDLDAALGRGDNAEVLRRIVARYDCRVGGGIRSYELARDWLNAGARSVILGTAAEPELLARLPKDRVQVALDARDGEVVVEGWRKGTGRGVLERIAELAPYTDRFLVTFVEKEGRMEGTRLDRARAIVEAAGDARVTIAGGVTTCEDVAALDRMGADAQVGMALYSGRMDLGEAVAAPLTSDREDGLWPTVVVDESERALGLCWSDAESVSAAVEQRRGIYRSRRRGLWVKGESSGATQELLRVDLDCDRDALRFVVRQRDPGFCHEGTRTCWGEDRGVPRLARRLAARAADAPEGSYTRRLLEDPDLLASKLLEEAGELAAARTPDEVAWEAADVVYFALVAMQRAGVSWRDVEERLDARELRVTRRSLEEAGG